MTGPETHEIRIADESGVGEARRAARRIARAAGLADVGVEQVAIVAAEASRNVAVHAHAGQILLAPAPGGGAVDVLALDRGPGVPDVARAMRDGYSTRGTAGQGLGAMVRISRIFDVYSAPGAGTALFARVGEARSAEALEVSGISVPVRGERECGDGWEVEAPEGRPVVLVADGLGHGRHAAEAARAALASFRQHAGLPAARLVEALHLALRPTRGAAVAVLEATGAGRGVRFAGVGNISGTIVGTHGVRKMVSLPGTAGHEARSIRAFDYDWPDGALLVLHSDGLATHWDLAAYPGLTQRHPALVAGVLYRDFARGRDDATVVVARWGSR